MSKKNSKCEREREREESGGMKELQENGEKGKKEETFLIDSCT